MAKSLDWGKKQAHGVHGVAASEQFCHVPFDVPGLDFRETAAPEEGDSTHRLPVPPHQLHVPLAPAKECPRYSAIVSSWMPPDVRPVGREPLVSVVGEADARVVLRQQVDPPLVAEPRSELRRSDDVGEEHRREDAVGDGRGTRTGQQVLDLVEQRRESRNGGHQSVLGSSTYRAPRDVLGEVPAHRRGNAGSARCSTSVEGGPS